LTIVSTVGLGLGLVAVAFSVLNAVWFRTDRVPNVHEIYTLERPRTSEDGHPGFTRAQFEALLRDTDVFSAAYAEVPEVDIRFEGRRFSGTLTTGNFFQVVGVGTAIGRVFSPADDGPGVGRPVMVLSDRGWERLFDRAADVLSRKVLVNGVEFDVIGVTPPDFRGLTVAPPDFWAPLSTLAYARPRRGGSDADLEVDIIGRLAPGLAQPTAQARVAVWAAHLSDARADQPRDAGVTLVPRNGTARQPAEALLITVPLFFGFGLILLIGCANVTNLLLARAVARQREIGIRLSIGAVRSRIVRQLLTESLLLALLAAAAGLAISRIALRVIINGVLTSWPPEIGDIRLLMPAADWRVVLFLIAGAVLSTVSFGLVPALQATRIEPLRTIRGEVIRDARPGRARDFLVGLQVCASALLLICAAVFLRSAFAAATVNPGIRTSDTVSVEIANEAYRSSVVRIVATEPLVAEVAASWPGVAAPSRTAVAQARSANAVVGYKLVSPEFFAVMGTPVLRGRAFTAGERSPAQAVAVISEATARTLWPASDAIGQVVRLAPDATSGDRRANEPALDNRSFTVVGIVPDVPGFHIAPLPKAMVYFPADVTTPATSLFVRVHGDADVARQALTDRLATIAPDFGEVFALRWVIRMETYLLKLAFWMTVVLGGLALALTLSGLFSVLSYLVEQRTREIGVRMALGATMQDIARLVLAQSVTPVGAGLLVGAATAAGASALLLTTSAAETIGQIVHVLDPVAYVASLLVIITACLAAASIPAMRAARLDPASTLRQD
jgi:predicted permease